MPIPTNPSFDTANAQLAKRPLYILTIDGIADTLTTFRAADMQVGLNGYGLNGYGLTGYGT